MAKKIFGVTAPSKDCTDKKCPFHGEINVKEEFLRGTIVKKDINNSATIEWKRAIKVPKYERTSIRLSRVRVHNPMCVDAQIGDNVMVARTRPLSKTKNHVILQVVGKEEILTSAIKDDETAGKGKKKAEKKESTKPAEKAEEKDNE